MCLYVAFDLTTTSVPNVVAPKVTSKSAASLFHLPYTEGVDYALGGNTVPNSFYAVNGHPSDIITASQTGENDASLAELDDVREASFARIDSTRDYNATSPLTIHATSDVYDDAYFISGTQTHHYGYTTCENLRVCDHPFEKVGSVCTAVRGTDTLNGYCYRAADTSLQCGRALATDGRFGSAIKRVTGNAMARCPAGTPLSNPGQTVVKRMLYGGCMLPGDANYKPFAEVHLPGDCATETTPMSSKGCLFPGARNYAPGAVESAKCLYVTKGCTSSTALNYNSEASLDDDSCVQPVVGCTLPTAGYAGIDSDTPMYKDLYVGSEYPNVGLVKYSPYGIVVKTDLPAANVLGDGSCTVVIEGCMDVTAVNYNPDATSNSGTWCIPPLSGCMMPMKSHTSWTPLPNSEPDSRPHLKDGGSANYDPSATVDSGCTPGRYGCTDLAAINFDPLANLADGSCFFATSGCLDRTALNFNCTKFPFYEKCTDEVPRATVHVNALCAFPVPPPSPPPPFPPAEFTTTVNVVSFSFVATGSVADYTKEKIDTIKTSFANQADVDPSKVTVTVVAASVSITVEVESDQPTTVQNNVASALASPEAASAFLSDAGVTVISTPVIEVKTTILAAPPAPPPASDSSSVGAIVGGIVGGIVVILLIVGVVYMYRKKKKAAKTTYPA